MTTSLYRIAPALALAALSLAHTSAAVAQDAQDAEHASAAEAPAPPRAIVTAMAGGGTEFVLRGAIDVRVAGGLYAGAGYAASVRMPEFFYHGPGVHAAYRVPLGRLVAFTPRLGFDVPLSAGRAGSTEYKKVTGHFPLVGVAGARIALHPSVFVVGIEGNVTVAGVEKDGSCTYRDSGACASGGESVGEPSTETLVGVHAGLVLGAAF